MEIAARSLQPAEPGGQIDQPLGNQMDDLAFDLQLPENTEHAGAEQFPALFFNELRMNDDIDQPAFVFQRDENDTGRRSRPLAADDAAGGADQGAVAGGFQLACSQETALGQVLAEQ